MSNYIKHKMRGKNPAVIAGMIVFGIIAGTGLAILLGFIIMWLWNGLMPNIFGLPTVTFWQAVGLFILSKILLGGFGGGSSSKNKNSDVCDSGKGKKKNDFSKWEHYGKFWEEQGDQAYQDYVDNLNDDGSSKRIADSKEETNETEAP